MIFSSSRIDIRNLQVLAFGLLILWGLTGQIIFLTGFPLVFALLGYEVSSQIREAREDGTTFNPLAKVLTALWDLFSYVHLVVGLTVIWVITQVVELRDSWLSSALSMSTGFGNWSQMSRPENYFGFDSQTSPFIHLWLVSALIQFVLILVVIGFVISLIKVEMPTFVGRASSLLVFVIAGYLLLSFRNNFEFTSEYFLSTWTWSWAVLLGFVIGFVSLRLPDSRLVAITSDALFVSFLALIIYGYFNLSFIGSHYLYLVILFIALLVFTSRNETLTYRFLTHDVVSFLAKLSFGAFLWHWPIAQFIKRLVGIEALGIAEILIIIIVSFALSYMASLIIERVSHTLKNLGGIRQWSTKVAVLAVVPLVLFFAQTPTSDQVEPDPTPTTVFTPSLADAENDVPDYLSDPKCVKDSTSCIYGDKKSDIHVVLFGNALAGNWQPALAKIAIDKGWKLEVRINPDCPSAEKNDTCESVLSETQKYLLRVKPDAVLTNFNVIATGSNQGPSQMRSRESITSDVTIFEKLIKAKVKVILLRGPSLAPENPLECLKSASDFTLDCVFNRSNSYMTGDELGRLLVFMATGVEIIDVTDEFCVQDMCFVAKPDGSVIYRTSTLITKTFSLSLAEVLAEKIQTVLDSPISTRPFNCRPGDRRDECNTSTPNQMPSN